MSELQGQVEVASTPSDLWEMLHTVTLLAKVVAETSTELTDSALKVRSWSLLQSTKVRQWAPKGWSQVGALIMNTSALPSDIMWAAQQGPF